MACVNDYFFISHAIFIVLFFLGIFKISLYGRDVSETMHRLFDFGL